MNWVRAVIGVLTAILGLLVLAGGLVVAVLTFFGDYGRPFVDWTPVVGGVIAMMVGIAFLRISSVVDGEY
ncbi:MAG TPA: hypothetical protein VF916_05435, partial [Ktedonobacterales bacterium]